MAISFDKPTFVDLDAPYLSAEVLNGVVNALADAINVINGLIAQIGDAPQLGTAATLNSPIPIANGGTGATTVAGARNALGLGNADGALPVANGGTGATTAAGAVTNIGAAAANHTHSLSSEQINGTLPVAKGGTGGNTASEARTALGLGGAAVKDVSTSVASGGGDLVTSGGVYTALSSKIKGGTDNPSGGASGDIYIKYSE